MRAEILFEDNHLLILNKPAGLLVHGDRTGDDTILDQAKGYIKTKYKKPGDVFLQPCHRLDRPVSGCLILARTSKAVTRMTKLFRTAGVFKVYWAVTEECPEKLQGVVSIHLRKNRKRNQVEVVAQWEEGQQADTYYQLAVGQEGKYLWKLKPQTGRSHQLRATMQYLGAPIVGDLKYGSSKRLGHQIALHCHVLSFEHPVRREPLEVRCLPADVHPWIPFKDHFSNL